MTTAESAAAREAAAEIDRLGVSAVLPAYNEEANLAKVVAAVRSAFERITANWEILAVNDGSRDRTGAIADELSRGDARVRALHHPVNRGYGAALRTGFAAASKGFIFYTDTDCQFDLGEFDRLLPLLPGADVVTGFRANRRDPINRRLSASLYKKMLSALFGLRVRDVDCAFKLYRSRLLKDLDLSSDSIFISGEALIKSAQRGAVIREVAVTHYPRREGTQTGNSPATLLRALREFVKMSPGMRRRGTARVRAGHGADGTDRTGS